MVRSPASLSQLLAKKVLLVAALVAAFSLAAVSGEHSREASAATSQKNLPGRSFTLPAKDGRVQSDRAAAMGGRTLMIWSNATAGRGVRVPSGTRAKQLKVRVRASQCRRSPRMTVLINNRPVKQAWVWQTSYTEYKIPVNIRPGVFKLEVRMSHDYSNRSCDRNLYLDGVKMVLEGGGAQKPPPPSGRPSGDLFSGAKLYVDPNSPAAQQASRWQRSRPADARQMRKIASGSQAAWFGEWNGNVRADVNRYVSTANKAGALPTLVAYNIPIRDCGSYSSGGARSAAEYRSWVDSVAAGIGSKKAAVVLEPDALALVDCLSAAQKRERYALINYAIRKLEKSKTDVYVDAGHSNWVSAPVMANRLKASGISRARGFALNVSNYETTGNNVRYGKSLSSKVGGKRFIVDTSRNGNGPGGTWCNPSGRALGPKPTSRTADPLVDAYMWVKRPGESDGTCNGGPPAGDWWAGYALGLAKRASY